VVDVRDVSMSSEYRVELAARLGITAVTVPLPQVFVGADHLGSHAQVLRMNEEKQLMPLLEVSFFEKSTEQRTHEEWSI
jgi:hypothetical protein